MARLKAAASMRQQQQPLQQAPSTKLFKHVPARLPPSQKVINEWLELENPTHAAAAVAVGTSSISTAAQAAAGSGFVMDANTGRLVPLQSSATQVCPCCSQHSPLANTELASLDSCCCTCADVSRRKRYYGEPKVKQ